MSSVSLSPQGLDFTFAASFGVDDDVARKNTWTSAEELAVYDPFDDDFLEEHYSAREELSDIEFAEQVNLPEPFDKVSEEAYWSGFMLGSDYDWDDHLCSEQEIEAWIQARYAIEIDLIEQQHPKPKIVESSEYDLLSIFFDNKHPTLRKEWKLFKQSNSNYDHLRGKAHAK